MGPNLQRYLKTLVLRYSGVSFHGVNKSITRFSLKFLMIVRTQPFHDSFSSMIQGLTQEINHDTM